MKPNEVKLSESQVTKLFQVNSKQHTSKSNASDFLTASAASSDRLNHLEDLINDHSTAQALKVSMRLNQWSDVVAKSIKDSRKSWFSLLSFNKPIKAAFATLAFAFFLTVAMPELSELDIQQPIHEAVLQQNITQNDVISVNQFDRKSDYLNKGSFERKENKSSAQDSLFNANFG